MNGPSSQDLPGAVPADAAKAQAPTAFLVGHIKVRDPQKWAEYCRRVPDTLGPWSASLVFRGKLAEILNGDHAYTDTVVIRFPDMAAIEAWHTSADYQALIPLRSDAADVLLLSYQQA